MQKGCAQLQTDRSGFPTLVCCLFLFFYFTLEVAVKRSKRLGLCHTHFVAGNVKMHLDIIHT